MTAKPSEPLAAASMLSLLKFSPDGVPTAETVRRVFPQKNDKRTDEELLSIGRWVMRFERVFATLANIKYEEAFQAKAKKRLANHEKYLRRKAKRREGEKVTG